MKLYEWMVKCTPQTEWIMGRGILLWLAFFFIELGAGAYLVGTFFGSTGSMIIGLLTCGILGGGLHFLYLGKPLRLYRMFLRPQTSWISRGMIFVTSFLMLGCINIILLYSGISLLILHIITAVFAFLVVIYGGFAMCCISGIPLWNTALLPIIYVVSGLWGGAGITLGVAISMGSAQLFLTTEAWANLLMLSFILLLVTYLVTINYGSLAAKLSVREIVKGSGRRIFWVIVVIIGIAVPVAMMISGHSVPMFLLYITLLCELVGDLGMRYLILKHGYYNPLIPTNTY